MRITQSQMQHLAYLRYLHRLAIDQAKLPEPMSSTSILLLHDAAESFLMLAAEKFGLLDSRQFMQYWDLLEPKLGERPHVEQGMNRLNEVRKQLKHKGVPPSRRSIERALEDTAAFMTSNVRLVFDQDYSSISMVDLIGQDLPRKLAQEAEAAISNGDIVTAMKRLREAFDRLFAAHRPEVNGERQSDFAFGPKPDTTFFRRSGLELDGIVLKLADSVQSIQAGVRLLALGLDYAEYLRFDRLTPQCRIIYPSTLSWSAPRGYAPDQEAFDFCMQFVVTAALRLADAESRAADPAWIQRGQYGRFEELDLGREPSVEDRSAPELDSETTDE